VRLGSRLYVGTFVDGLAAWDGARWTTWPALAGQNVTALEPDGTGGLFVATRGGVWRQRAPGSVPEPWNKRFSFLEPEAQSLCAVPGGVWIGARTGLFFVPRRDWSLSGGTSARGTGSAKGPDGV
jgi:ligand-binding sensor domain-containing protein